MVVNATRSEGPGGRAGGVVAHDVMPMKNANSAGVCHNLLCMIDSSCASDAEISANPRIVWPNGPLHGRRVSADVPWKRWLAIF